MLQSPHVCYLRVYEVRHNELKLSRSLHAITSLAIETLYSHNIDLIDTVAPNELMGRRVRLSSLLEQWRDDVSPFCDILSAADLGTWTPASFDLHRFQVLLTIQYYSAKLLIAAPILTTFLTAQSIERKNVRELTMFFDAAFPVIEEDFTSAQDLQQVIFAIVSLAPNFLDSNASWWTCNFRSELDDYLWGFRELVLILISVHSVSASAGCSPRLSTAQPSFINNGTKSERRENVYRFCAEDSTSSGENELDESQSSSLSAKVSPSIRFTE